jgi:hypothetical protein
MGGGGCVLHAALFHLRSVGEFCVFGEVEGPVDEGGVEVIDVSVVAEASRAGLLIRRGLAEGNVSGLPVLWNFASVNLMSEVVNDIVRPDSRRGPLRIDATDTARKMAWVRSKRGSGRATPVVAAVPRCRRRYAETPVFE